MSGGEIVRGVDHQIHRRHRIVQGTGGQRLLKREHSDFGIDGPYAAGKGIGLVFADRHGRVTDLALQIGEVDRIAIG